MALTSILVGTAIENVILQQDSLFVKDNEGEAPVSSSFEMSDLG